MTICIYTDDFRLQARFREPPQDLPNAGLQNQAGRDTFRSVRNCSQSQRNATLPQMMFTKYFVVAGTDLHSQLSMINHHPTPDRELSIDATKKIPGEGFKRPWQPLIKMDAAVKAKVEKLFNP